MPDFSKARLGDRVFDILEGDGEIIFIGEDFIQAKFNNGALGSYGFDGKYDPKEVLSSLYWSKPEISDPPPPKRMKKVVGWVNIYKYPKEYRSSEKIYGCESDATTSAAVATVPIEFEVEEAD